MSNQFYGHGSQTSREPRRREGSRAPLLLLVVPLYVCHAKDHQRRHLTSHLTGCSTHSWGQQRM